LDPNTGLGAVSYDVQQAGDTVVVDGELIPRVVAGPSVWIEDASAEVGAGSLQVPLTGNQQTSMTQYLQPEFKGRPPGGAYLLRLLTPSEGSLCGVDDVEVYMSVIYWVTNGP